MKAKLTDWLTSLSGTFGKDYYASRCPNEPGYVLIKRKPGPHNHPGQRHRWTMPEGQAAVISAFQANQRRASVEYNDPIRRAQWQLDYDTWCKKERKRGRSANMLNGKHVRYLWDYVRICCQSATPPESVSVPAQ